MSEHNLQKNTIRELKEAGWFVINISPTGNGNKGIPDLICCPPGGKFVAIELKVKGNSTTPAQKINLKKIARNGGEAVTAYNMEEIRNLIKEHKRRSTL